MATHGHHLQGLTSWARPFFYTFLISMTFKIPLSIFGFASSELLPLSPGPMGRFFISSTPSHLPICPTRPSLSVGGFSIESTQ